MSEKLLSFDDFISPIVRVIIKSKIETILNKIYPRNTTFKSILFSENLNPNAQYSIMKNPIDLNKPIIELVPKKNIITELELVIEADILDLDFNTFDRRDSVYFKILRPFENPFRILSFSPKDNNISIKKFPYQTLHYFCLDNFTCSKSSYCNTPYDLYISGGNGGTEGSAECKNFIKINNTKIKIEKLEELPLEKESHSMIFIPKKYIYFIGGKNRGTFYYDIIFKTFKLWGPLKSKKIYPALVLVNNSIIYAFGQQNKITDIDFIEKTNIKISPKWEIVNVKLGQQFTLRRFGAVLSNDDRIYFVGGRKNKDDKILFFDIKNKQIDKSNQINSAIKISESNFYNLNDFSSVLLPQETKGDIRIIIFNRRTKRFRKAKYERDYDIISQNEYLEIDNNFENEIQIKSEINYKIIENKYEIKIKKQKEELKMPSLLDIKKILLGNKNILNKNVEAMVFNRKSIKIRKSDYIDDEESEKEYEEYKEDDEMDEMEEDNFNNSKEENYKKKIHLRFRKPLIEENNDYTKMTLKDVFSYNEYEPIFLKLKNPIINLEDYKINYAFNNKSHLNVNKPLSNITGNNKKMQIGKGSTYTSGTFKGQKKSLNFDFDTNNNISNKEEIINNSINKLNPLINMKLINNENIISSDKIDINKEKDNNLSTNKNETKRNNENNFIPSKNFKGKNNNSELNNNLGDLNYNINLNGKISNINEFIESGITSIVGDFNKLYMKNTNKGLTLKELFGRDVDEEISLNLAKVIVPTKKATTISGTIKGKKENQNIKGNTSFHNVNNNYNIKGELKDIKPNVNTPNITSNLKSKSSGKDLNVNRTNIYNTSNFSITLKEIFNKNINDNIFLNIKNPKIIGDNNYNISGIIDGKLSTSNIDINGKCTWI